MFSGSKFLVVPPLDTSMKHFVAMSVEILWFLIIPAQAFSTRALMSPPVMALAAAPTSNMAVAAPSLTLGPRPGCPAMCGGVHIPYPFGIGGDCSWNGTDSIDFTINCNHSFSPPRPYTGDFEIISISLEAGEMRVFSPVSYTCTTTSSSQNNTKPDNGVFGWSLDFAGTPFLISSSRNVFTGIGCDMLVFIEGRKDRTYFTGCISSCESLQDAAHNGEGCTGLGCCKTDIPGNLNTVTISWSTGNDTHVNPAWSPCSYAFVAEKGWYHFNVEDLSGVGNMSFIHRVGERTIPVVLDWAIRTNGGSCQIPEGQTGPPTASACLSNHSFCVDAKQGSGYLCNCSKGYEGNPYLIGGCTDINECELRKSNPAMYRKIYPCGEHSTCHNMPGDYKCKCKFGHRGDGKSAWGCHPIIPGYAIAIVGTFVAIFFLVLLLWFIYMDRKRRVKMACFDKNGGEVLKEAAGIAIFTQEQLIKITNNYDTPIGKGAFGSVFLGATNDKERVAVKRSHFENKKGGQLQQVGEFVNEITFQFQNRHTNLVRLVGCCLETNIPVLVYEYISKGNLYTLLHVHRDKVLLLRTRLNIAIGSSEALAYMHSHADRDRIHGDVKSANILLNDNLTPKVSDFGSSRLLSNARYATEVAADMSYMDPMYMITHRFVPKSDVYSFGIVLLELITRKTVRYGKDRSLPVDFVKSSKERGNARELYDGNISSHDGNQCHYCVQCLDKIGALAVRCLMYDDDERPTMAEVVDELKQAANLVDNCNVSEHTAAHV